MAAAVVEHDLLYPTPMMRRSILPSQVGRPSVKLLCSRSPLFRTVTIYEPIRTYMHLLAPITAVVHVYSQFGVIIKNADMITSGCLMDIKMNTREYTIERFKL